ncbi:hypothetical protein PR003_g12711 [Phytophthora rubi]|uniref:Uncharacterized protein n=1 Tax=Phytophthora rubi TaxID=129364 RepID=A0A6A3M582_9STRA|nr:hypothetical protein PR002_g11132 [Phytophthora rubi]KAE9027485.1 hypothetical protein PR001_g11953 [Phytophthora rubi]KAE9336030.1 hypothetical protein PR003_g12711 [Phytophthora rubi]
MAHRMSVITILGAGPRRRFKIIQATMVSARGLVLMLVLLSVATFLAVDARTSKLEGTQAYRQAPSRPRVSEVVFSNEEESLLRGQQSDTAHMLAARLPGKTPFDVQRRCVQLGLRCGGDAKAPERNSEKWRTSPRSRT